MIAQLRILLPYTLAVAPEAGLQGYEREVEGYRVRVYPPHRSRVDRSVLEPDSLEPLFPISRQLGPLDPQPATEAVLVDGRQTVLADALQIDFLRDEFDRRVGTEDPPTELGFQIANDLLDRLRTLGRAGQVKPVLPTSTVWRLTYLRDDESEVEPVEGLYRSRNGVSWHWKLLALRESRWTAAQALPDNFEPTPWDTLLLDALDLLPEVGPTLVLALAAIETRVESALDVLAPMAGVSAELWQWIKEREGDYRKEPSVAEQLHHLLHALSGHSLREDARLWQAFRNLHAARNSFVHQGRAMIGGQPVTSEQASQLVALTGDIIDWIERLLPESERRPRYAGEGERAMQLTKLLAALAEPPASS